MEKKTATQKKKAMAPGERIKKYSSPGTRERKTGMSAEMKRRKAVGDRNRKEREAFKGMSKAAKMREFQRMGILAPSERGK
jgi:hypothetical protein